MEKNINSNIYEVLNHILMFTVVDNCLLGSIIINKGISKTKYRKIYDIINNSTVSMTTDTCYYVEHDIKDPYNNIWNTKDKKSIKISHLDNNHLNNIIKWFYKHNSNFNFRFNKEVIQLTIAKR